MRAVLAKRSLLVLLSMKFLVWTQAKKPTGKLKNMHKMIEALIMMYLRAVKSHPTHNS